MKISSFFSIFVLSVILCSFFGNNASAQQSPKTTSPSREQRDLEKQVKKQEEREAKERKKQAEREAKERLKRPAQILINSPATIVRPVVVAALQSWNYQLDEESPNRVSMSKPVTGFGNQLLTEMAIGNGAQSRYRVQVSLAEISGSTNVMFNFSVVSQNAFGKTNYVSVDSNKKLRREVDSLLNLIRLEAEHASQRVAEPPKEHPLVNPVRDDTTVIPQTPHSVTDTDKILVDVLSEPLGAEIYIDGIFIGSTPSKILLVAGEHKIKLVRAGFKDWERNVNLELGNTITFNAFLEKLENQ